MFACFALLLDDEAHNRIRKLAYQLLRDRSYGIEAALLTQHISLKQSFYVSDLHPIEQYFDRLVRELSSFEVMFNKVDLISMGGGGKESQVLWVDIEDNVHVRNTHNKLNEELLAQYSIPLSGFDGPEFHFHSTLAIGSNQYEKLEKWKNEINSSFEAIPCNVEKAALFYSLDDQLRAGRFMTHKIGTLGG